MQPVGSGPWDEVEVGHEVGREAVEIAPDRFVQVLGLDAIERGQTTVQHDLATQSGAHQNTPPMGSDSAGEAPGIVLFLRFLAFRASDRNGCARLWVFGTGMRIALRESRWIETGGR